MPQLAFYAALALGASCLFSFASVLALRREARTRQFAWLSAGIGFAGFVGVSAALVAMSDQRAYWLVAPILVTALLGLRGLGALSRHILHHAA